MRRHRDPALERVDGLVWCDLKLDQYRKRGNDMTAKLEPFVKDFVFRNSFLYLPALILLTSFCTSFDARADQSYSTDQMSGIYAGAWVQTAYNFTYYEPVSGFEDLKSSRDAVMSDAIYYRYNKALDLFVLIYRGFQDYEPTLDGIRNYVTGLGSTGIRYVNCNGLDVIQFENQTDHYKELNIAFPDLQGAIIQVTVQCSNDDIMYAFGHEVFASILPDTAAEQYLASIGEESFGHIYHLSDFGTVYQGSWVTLLDFFRFCAPSEAGWSDLTGTDAALSSDAIGMYKNDSLGIIIIIYYGFQPYHTTDGIYDALREKPEYLNLHYARCNGLKVTEFEKENRDHSIAFADSAGGIVQVTVQCQDPTLRYLYSNQLFSSLAPADMQAANGNDIPEEYKAFLSQSVIENGSENLYLEGSQYAILDVNADQVPELLVRYPAEGTPSGLGDIYVYVLADGQTRFAGTLCCSATMVHPGYSSQGYYYEECHDYPHTSYSWNLYELSGASLNLVITLRIEFNLSNLSLSTYYLNDEIVSADEFNSTFILFLDGSMIADENGIYSWNGYRNIPFTENIYVGVFWQAPAQTQTAGIQVSLTDAEKKIYADYLSDDNWQYMIRPDDEYNLFPLFALEDITGDGKEELVVQSTEGSSGSTYFYALSGGENGNSGDPVLIGGMYLYDAYVRIGYNSAAHLPYYFWNDKANTCMGITVFKYECMEMEDYDAVFYNEANTLYRFDIVDGVYSVNGTEVSEAEFSDQFKQILGDPIPYLAADSSHYEWDGYEPFSMLQNTSQNRLQVLGYEGTPLLWD